MRLDEEDKPDQEERGRKRFRQDEEAARMGRDRAPETRRKRSLEDAWAEEERRATAIRRRAEERQMQKRQAEQEAERSREDKRRREAPDSGDTDIINSIAQVDVADMYSPIRVMAHTAKFGLKAGEAMDLTTGWELRKQQDRDRARKYQKEHRPKLLIGSPMCTMFSSLQNLCPWTQDRIGKWEEAKDHIEFVVELYREQMRNNRVFLHEHPTGASSWGLECVKKLEREEGVMLVIADQCMYGLVTRGNKRREAKPP